MTEQEYERQTGNEDQQRWFSAITSFERAYIDQQENDDTQPGTGVDKMILAAKVAIIQHHQQTGNGNAMRAGKGCKPIVQIA